MGMVKDVKPKPVTSDVEKIRDYVSNYNAEAVVWEPEAYDAALVGVGQRCGAKAVAVYDYGKLVEITKSLCNGSSEEKAEEYVDVNFLGSYVGESTPIVLMQPCADVALEVFDSFLKDTDSFFSPERQQEMVLALKTLLPKSKYAQR
tara:strand:+ start:69 stop:509 length:441 start_codon:yes stop_codon:yes gene_type:complete